ncbi:conjugative relaxase domain-containing protein, TrwC/TraI family [Actinacidiphila alni]|uniref:Conjugative relaxase domain-containing protein, TrwC/TraI family n=2 Tax=Actinacidiphila alni TaxID=380248 RepID=A0A1I2L8E0_9ACTN|nr:conjugative relaxase domain-containing protein, TrwC/TraI family [Actinacidiphila alni]
MTIHKLSAGDGYRYYVQETAAGDARRPVKSELGDYYTADGNPPGIWMGAGAAALGVAGTVTEQQMAALYGEGLHPNADTIIRSALDEGLSVAAATRRARLGRRYYRYDRSGPLTAAIQDAVDTFTARTGREPGPEERRKLRAKVGAVAFREGFGRSPRSSEELGRYISAQEAPAQQAVAGWDLVMRAPEDISKGLFGLGDDAVCAAVVECHDAAVRETLRWIEQHALATRTGINGIAQEDVAGGLIATRFRHFDNRLGEPLLHDHVVVSNKVRGLDGKWRSLDGKLLYAMGVAASEHYNQRVVELVCRRLGLAAEEREVTAGKRPVIGITGFDRAALQPHSRRTKDIRQRLDELLRAYGQQHRGEPTAAVRAALIQQATLETRPAKKKRSSLEALRKGWRSAAVRAVGEQRVARLLRTAQAAAVGGARAGGPADVDIAEAAEDVLATVSEQRAVWAERHVIAETRRHVVRLTAGQGADDELVNAVVRAVLKASLSINPPDLHQPFAPLQRSSGSSIYRRREADLYTSRAVLDAEAVVLNAARARVIPALARAEFSAVSATFPQLDPGQRHLAEEFACSDRLVVAGTGPAGSGKTTALKAVRAAVTAGGGRLIPLAPSSRAAKVLGDALGTKGFTLHSWLAERERIVAPSSGSREPRRPRRRPGVRRKAAPARRGSHQLRQSATLADLYALGPGDVILVDEAGMAGSQNLARIVAEATAAGALVRLVGDPYQLGSVEAGGLLRQITRDPAAVHVDLDMLRRFSDPAEAQATLALRDGDPAQAFRWYLDHHRVVGGTREEMLADVFAAWQADTDAGVHTIMMADSADSVRDLNARAHTAQVIAGAVDMRRSVTLRDDVHAGVGDLIVTRQNTRQLPVRGARDHVKNGDQWVVESIGPRGAAQVRHTGHGGRVMLPAGYLEQQAELGYACTVHRAQGLSIHTAHGLITAATSRESAYVMATRGELSNRLYVATDGSGQTVRDVLETVAASRQASVSAHDVIRNEQERAYSISQLAAEYTDVNARAASVRIQAVLRRVLGGAAEWFIGAEAWGVLERSLRDAEKQGWDLTRLVPAAYAERDFHDADDASAVLAWRIDNRLAEGAQALSRAAKREREPGRSRPLKDLADEQLQHLFDLAQRHRRTALDELRRADAAVASQPRTVVVGGLPSPAWPLRPYGHLTHAELAESIATARRSGRRTDAPLLEGTAVAREEALLRQEQRLRRRMNRRDRMREDWQRESVPGAAHTASGPVTATIAELSTNFHRQDHAHERLAGAQVIVDRIAAERRLRQQLPDRPALRPDHGADLPDWLAPADSLRDPDTPEAWRAHMVERRAVIAQRLEEAGVILASERPDWVRPLGPVPSDDHPLRREWERTAALALAWRIRHSTPESDDGIGEPPPRAEDLAAWTSLHDRVRTTGRRARATAAALSRPQDPASGIRIAARTAAGAQRRMLNRHLANAADRSVLTDSANAFADVALTHVMSGAEPPEPWVVEIPSPRPGDDVQAEQWRILVTAIDTYRLLNGVDGSDPLGDNDRSDNQEELAEMQAALTLFQRSRTHQHLNEIRRRRESEGRPHDRPADRYAAGAAGSRVPPAAPTGTGSDSHHSQRRTL